jgi:hypothetical protein
MSSRAARKLQTKSKSKPLPHDEDSDIEINEDEDSSHPTTHQQKNLFDMLNENDESDDNNDQDPEPTSNKTEAKQKTNKAQTKPKKKRKNKAKKASQDDDSFLEQLKNETQSSHSQPQTQKDVFRIEPKNLNILNEMKRMFGSKLIDEELGRQRQKFKSKRQRNYLLVEPQPNWPRVTSTGISFKSVQTKNGLTYYQVVWSDSYKKTQQLYNSCVRLNDLNGLSQLLVETPYHVDTLLQLSEVLKETGEYQQAEDLVQRALFCIEEGWQGSFFPGRSPSRLIFTDCEENKGVFLALFRWLQLTGRKACHRTALEIAKLIMWMDRSDPLGILLCLDFHALMSRQYAYFVEVCDELEKTSPQLRNLCNVVFSLALAKFYLASTPEEIEVSKQHLLTASFQYPALVTILCDKLGLKIPFPPYFSSTNASETETPFYTLFVEKNSCLWSPAKVQQWLKETLLQAVEMSNNDQFPSLDIPPQSSARSLFRFLHFSEFRDIMPVLPAELELDGGIGGGIGGGVPQEPQFPFGEGAADTHPLMLFLSTLFPWSNPQQPAQQNNQTFQENLQSIFQRLYEVWNEQSDEE